MIPKIIHQTWKTRDLPERLQHWHTQVKDLHPEWVVNLWTDEDNLRLVQRYYPSMVNIYKSLEYDIMRVDIIRYIYMEIFGGYYLDLDYELLHPFDDEVSNMDIILPVSREVNGKVILGNCVFGSIAHHVFWKDVLAEFSTNPPVKKIYNKNKIFKLTGPEFITRVYFRYPEKYHGTLAPKNLFHPASDLRKTENYRQILIQNGTRGIHHCMGSWLRTKNPLVYILTKLNSARLMLSSMYG